MVVSPDGGDEGLAAEYIKAHASPVGEIMTRNVITAAPDTPLHRIAEMLEKYGIKVCPLFVIAKASEWLAGRTSCKQLQLAAANWIFR